MLLCALAAAVPGVRRAGICTLGFLDDAALLLDSGRRRHGSTAPRAATRRWCGSICSGRGSPRRAHRACRGCRSQLGWLPVGGDRCRSACRNLARPARAPDVQLSADLGGGRAIAHANAAQPAPGRLASQTPAALRAFATAAARRYSGQLRDADRGAAPARLDVAGLERAEPRDLPRPAVGSPRRDDGRRPALAGTDGCSTASTRGVKAVQPRATIVSAGTAPYGDPPGRNANAPGGVHARVPLPSRPARYAAAAVPTQRISTCSPTTRTAVGGPDRHAINADDVSVPDLASSRSRFGRPNALGARFRAGSKALWITEISWDSSPPDPQGVPIARHAQWLQESLYTYCGDKGARVVIWLNIADQPPNAALRRHVSVGVVLQGRTDPSPRRPRSASRSLPQCSKKRCSAWGRSPASASSVRIERRSGSDWLPVRSLRAGANGIFSGSLGRRRAMTLRATAGSESSLSWRQARMRQAR